MRAQVADLPSVTDVQDAKVKKAMDLLKVFPRTTEDCQTVGS